MWPRPPPPAGSSCRGSQRSFAALGKPALGSGPSPPHSWWKNNVERSSDRSGQPGGKQRGGESPPSLPPDCCCCSATCSVSKPWPERAGQEQSDTEPVLYLRRVLSISWKRENAGSAPALPGRTVVLGQPVTAAALLREAGDGEQGASLCYPGDSPTQTLSSCCRARPTAATLRTAGQAVGRTGCPQPHRGG